MWGGRWRTLICGVGFFSHLQKWCCMLWDLHRNRHLKICNNCKHSILHHPAYSGLYLGSCSCGFVNFAMWIIYFSQSALPLPVFGTSASQGKHRWWPQTAAPLEALTATRRRIKLISSQKPSAQAQARKPSSWLWMLKMRRLFSPGAKGISLGWGLALTCFYPLCC